GTASALVYRAGAASNVAPVEVHNVSPGILDHGVIPSGKPCPVSVTNGVRPGTYLEIYGTGLGGGGLVAGAGLASGVAPLAPVPVDAPPRSFLDTRELRVLYSGLVPGMVGLYQTNTQVPADFPPGAPVGLRLSAGGVDSNSYPIAVLGDSDQPQFTLNANSLNFVVQAGGPPQTARMTLDGQNGFCELVRFSVTGMPDGVSASLPVGFPGQPVPVTVQASSQASAAQDVIAAIQSFSSAAQSPAAFLHVTVLPSRGDIRFRVTSGGGHAGLVARFEMAGRVMYEAHGGGPGRGFNFLTLNDSTGVLGAARNFDTWLSEQASEAMADYLTGLPAGTVVLGAIADEGTLHLTPRARTALRQTLGAQLTDGLHYQDSWAIIARVGAPVPIAENAASDQPVVLERVLTFPMP
ncbi:MAG TPA: interleukin-like EMT inducer domain-containing protein, partial [Bryobacterales bacterium]|nr:interleukin-like EMT inducer domain-containing protein [Bryobacterales bacterium]